MSNNKKRSCATQEGENKMAMLTVVEAINAALHKAMSADKNIVVLGEDVGIDGGVFRVTDGLFKKFGKERVMDTPLAEAAIVGTSIGMAMAGLRPVCEIQFSGFAYQAFYQVEQHLARMRNRSQGSFTCPVVMRLPYGGGIRALEHHSESREAYYAHTPGVVVVMPSSPTTAKGLLLSAVKYPDPVIYMEPKRMYRSMREEVPDNVDVPIGKAFVEQKGDAVTLISYGASMMEARQAAKQVKGVELIDLRTISPFDRETILASVRKTGRCVITHEANVSFGVGAEIAALLADKAIDSLRAPVRRVCGYDTPFPAFKIEDHYIPTTQRIVDALNEVISY